MLSASITYAVRPGRNGGERLPPTNATEMSVAATSGDEGEAGDDGEAGEEARVDEASGTTKPAQHDEQVWAIPPVVLNRAWYARQGSAIVARDNL